MHSRTDHIRCLVVEDDPYKMDGICAHLRCVLGDRVEVTECQALSSATTLLATSSFDLAILDMSIHSHKLEAGTGSPFSLSSGGLDVLFEIEYSKAGTICVILTQYPDIEIDGTPVSIEQAQKEILEKFDIHVAGCVRYVEDDDQWKSEVSFILGRL